MPLPDWIHVADVAALAQHFAIEVDRLAAEAVHARGAWTIAIPGGSAVQRIMPAVASASLPWDRSHVFWCDERAVPPADPESNWQALHRVIGGESVVWAATLHRMPADAHDLASAAVAYGRELEEQAGTPPVLDVVLLGMGEDGHVASLFPDRPAVDEQGRVVVLEEQSPKPPARRLSLGLPVLAGARLTCVAAFGSGKQDAVRAAVDPGSSLPAAKVLRAARRPMLLLDPAAAAALPLAQHDHRRDL